MSLPLAIEDCSPLMSRRRRVVLFDIDGTLVLTGRAGVRGMNAAFRRVHGWAQALAGVEIAGRTDRAIVADVLTRGGLAADEPLVAALRDAYLEDLLTEIRKPVPEWSGVLPGVNRLLDELGRREDVGVGLLTGNFEGGAAIKLGHFDLWRRFPFGAFGDRHVNRRDLVPVAVARAAQAGFVEAGPHDVIVIGDTPYDIDCAVAHGARAIGVATGPFTTTQLAAAGAHLVVETLEAVADVGGWIDRY
jgi:phosphoglycolate phosphatase-like HAD superfamily hydrolase